MVLDYFKANGTGGFTFARKRPTFHLAALPFSIFRTKVGSPDASSKQIVTLVDGMLPSSSSCAREHVCVCMWVHIEILSGNSFSIEK